MFGSILLAKETSHLFSVRRGFCFPFFVVFLLPKASHDRAARSGSVIGRLGEATIATDLKNGPLERVY